MREIDVNTIKDTVKSLFIEANHTLGDAETALIYRAKAAESDPIPCAIMDTIAKNLDAAKEIEVPICQDTGMAVVILHIGQEVHFVGGNLEKAINDGVSAAYTDGKMRASVVKDPLFDRVNTKDNTPAVIHTHIVDGDKVSITALPKGFGSENMSTVRMMKPTDGKEKLIDFVVETVRTAGSNPCPPIEVGIGIGGTFDYVTYLAKVALSRNADEYNSDPEYADLEKEILERINALGIGPQGFGGKTTALKVNIEKYPTHIAGMPVAVNINCHVMRHKTAVI
ncbi:MAG: fumarate hydratase [Clostridia bacterium]|nr:fumarate hydratase [Clostridia bacterium]